MSDEERDNWQRFLAELRWLDSEAERRIQEAQQRLSEVEEEWNQRDGRYYRKAIYLTNALCYVCDDGRVVYWQEDPALAQELRELLA